MTLLRKESMAAMCPTHGGVEPCPYCRIGYDRCYRKYLICGTVLRSHGARFWVVARNGPPVATIEPVVRVELERVEALEILGMTLAHLGIAEARVEMSPRVSLLMAIRDKLALALQEEA